MRTRMKTALAAAGLGVGVLAAPALDAHDMGGSMMGSGMMGQGGGMMGQGGMMGMMGDMAGMMEQCHQMMQAMGGHDHGPGRPDQQRHEPAPSIPDERG